MSNYYKDKQRAYMELDNIIQNSIKRKTNINITMVVLDLTSKHPVSDKALKNRINEIASVYNLKIVNDELICEVKV
ncbi:MAG TPA: hypothetical protein VMR41_03005 [Patescibacteria group bacterium]|nr:hypothetical protein [Patescibacteria group bacterium]